MRKVSGAQLLEVRAGRAQQLQPAEKLLTNCNASKPPLATVRLWPRAA